MRLVRIELFACEVFGWRVIIIKQAELNFCGAKNMSNLDAITLLFQRPNEPLFTAKDNGKTIFELPSDFYTKRYESIGLSIGQRLGEDAERTIPLRSVQHPNLEFALPVRIRGPFNLFNHQHQQIAGQLIEILLQTPGDDLVSMAGYIKDRINPYLFLVSYSS